MLDKKTLRKKLKQVRDNLTAQDKARRDSSILSKISQLLEQHSPDQVFTYLNFGSEPDFSSALIRSFASIKFAVPVIDSSDKSMEFVSFNQGDELRLNSYGVEEPLVKDIVPTSAETILLAPCLAFNEEGGRLGYGGGYYDRYMAGRKFNKIVGICYDEGALQGFQNADHDIPLEIAITDSRVVYF